MDRNEMPKTLLIFVTAVLMILNAFPGTAKDEFSSTMLYYLKNLNYTPYPVATILFYNPQFVISLYPEDDGVISARWESRSNIDQMLKAIKGVDNEGLNPNDYHLDAIKDIVSSIPGSGEMDIIDKVKLDLLLSDAFLLLAFHMLHGKTDKNTFIPVWNLPDSAIFAQLKGIMETALEKGDVKAKLYDLLPSHREYSGLRESLTDYRNIMKGGGWESFSTALQKLEKGLRHPDVNLLRDRLETEQGSILPASDDKNLFDDSLHEQVILFRKRHGMEATGIVDQEVINLLNISVSERIKTIKSNLERWRWIEDVAGERVIRVNIADFRLEVIEDELPLFSLKAIVGTPERQTPVLRSWLNYMELNPYWIVPPNILEEDIIPAIRSDVYYLEERDLVVLDEEWNVVDAGEVDWHDDFNDEFHYTIRQEPGPGNEMGQIKFEFPNPYFVNIHDTPYRELFNKEERMFSSGCIRIEEPLRLAAWILENDPEWTMSHLIKFTDEGTNRGISLKEPVPVEIVYLTARTDNDRLVHFREDVYYLDQRVSRAMEIPPPVPETKFE